MTRCHLSSNQRHFIIFCMTMLLSLLLSTLLLRYITELKDSANIVTKCYMPAQKSCREVRHIVFVKVPKTGSTTLQNIFFRFGISRELRFMLPKVNNLLSKTRMIDKKDIFPLITNDSRYDILCNHVRYNKTDLLKFTFTDTTRIAIIREPGAHLKSYLYYYYASYLYQQPSAEIDIIKKYLKQPELHAGKILSNPMSEWFSLLPMNGTNITDKGKLFQDSLFKLDRDFKLILVLEKMDESLVLMKRLLCWNLEDIVYIPRNTNQFYPRGNLTVADKLRHEHISRFDYILYSYFLGKLNSLIEESGEDFQDEVRVFKRILVSVQNFCENWRRKIGTSLSLEPSPWNNGFYISAASCLLLTNSEIELQRYVGLWQYGDIWDSIHRDTAW